LGVSILDTGTSTFVAGFSPTKACELSICSSDFSGGFATTVSDDFSFSVGTSEVFVVCSGLCVDLG